MPVLFPTVPSITSPAFMLPKYLLSVRPSNMTSGHLPPLSWSLPILPLPPQPPAYFLLLELMPHFSVHRGFFLG